MNDHITYTGSEASPLPLGGAESSRRRCRLRQRVRVRVLLGSVSVALLLTAACSTTTPRVLEVSSRTRLQDFGPAEAREYYGYDDASRFRYEPQDLSVEDQREEFYVRWAPASISLVKFEYRQVAKPATIFEKTYTPHGDMAKLFEVRGEDFRAGGSVSAWRVTLWNGDQLVAEKKSFLW